MGHLHYLDKISYGYPVDIFAVVIGITIILLGRKLFWLFVGAVGFISGLHIATYALYGRPEWMILLIGLFAGILGAVLAVFLQRIAVGAAGFFAGGYLIEGLIYMAGWQVGDGFWILFLIGGIIGALVASAYFDWALIMLSTLTGAAVVSQSLPFVSAVKAVVLTALIIAGIFTQAGFMKKDRRSRT
jgi:hypothetical protein